MKIYKSDKLFFDKEKISFEVNRRTVSLFRQFVIPSAPKKFNIELLEISKAENPSDIEIEIVSNFIQKQSIKLYQFRTDFIFQNGFFILSTKDKKQFQLEVPETNTPDFGFAIHILSDEEFKMALYYSTDQEEYQSNY